MFRVAKAIFARTIREHLPKLENTLTAEYDITRLGDDERLIMLAGVAKDPVEARRLMDDYQCTSALDLLDVLPKRKIHWRRRLRLYIQGIEGSVSNDPYERLLWPDGSESNRLKVDM